jgi:hypothetical protein
VTVRDYEALFILAAALEKGSAELSDEELGAMIRRFVDKELVSDLRKIATALRDRQPA